MDPRQFYLSGCDNNAGRVLDVLSVTYVRLIANGVRHIRGSIQETQISPLPQLE